MTNRLFIALKNQLGAGAAAMAAGQAVDVPQGTGCASLGRVDVQIPQQAAIVIAIVPSTGCQDDLLVQRELARARLQSPRLGPASRAIAPTSGQAVTHRRIRVHLGSRENRLQSQSRIAVITAPGAECFPCVLPQPPRAPDSRGAYLR